MSHTKPSSAPLKMQAGASALHQAPLQLHLWLLQPTFETLSRFLCGKQPGPGYSEPAHSVTKPKTYHFPVAFLDVLIFQGFVQVEARRKNNNQVREEPQVTHLLPKTHVLPEETQQDTEDQRDTPGSHTVGVSTIYFSIRHAVTSLRLNNGCRRSAMVEAPAPGHLHPKCTLTLGEGSWMG